MYLVDISKKVGIVDSLENWKEAAQSTINGCEKAKHNSTSN